MKTMKHNMKESLRKSKSTNKDSDILSQTTVEDSKSTNSGSTDALGNNPWSSEIGSGDGLDRVTSTGQTTINTVGSWSTKAEAGDGYVTATSHEEKSAKTDVAPTTNGEVKTATDEKPKKTKRKKTVTQPTPHTFQLEDELKKQKSTEQQQQQQRSASNGTKPSESKPAKPASNNEALPSRPTPAPAKPPVTFSYSPIRTNLNLHPIEPPPPPPISPRPRRDDTPNNPFTATHQRRKSSKSVSNGTAPPLTANLNEPYVFHPSPKPSEDLFQKVILLTHGTSMIGSSLVRQFHSVGARVIIGDTDVEKARKLIRNLGPPDTVHFNQCHATKHHDVVALFKFAMNMYGRVDHAVFGVGDDGSVGITVGEAEELFGLDLQTKTKTAKQEMEDVTAQNIKEGFNVGDVVSASVRFARIAMAHLRSSPIGRKKRVSSYSSVSGETQEEQVKRPDRSLTFITSSAAIKGVLHLPIYQVTQHATLGVVRSLSSSVDPNDGVRVNAVMTNIMVPSVKAGAGGRMSLQFPPDRPEDVARVVASVVDDAVAGELASHGRLLYVASGRAIDLQDGLDRSEGVWVGGTAKPVLDQATLAAGRDSQWMLGMGDGLDP